MARTRKKKLDDTIKDYHTEEFLTEPVADNMNHNMLVYSQQALTRAIPDVRDGLITVRRRIIYTLSNDAKLTSSSKHVKVAKLAGLTLGYHPHGDKSVSEAMTHMSQPWKLNAPLVDIEGNNGSTKNRDAADGRYLEGRLAPYSEYMLGHIKDNAVDMVPNYDNTAMEPTVLPAEFPQLLVNGTEQSKMAVGFATNIAPHNIVELTKAAELVNRKPEATLSEVMRLVPGPCLPTGNIVMGREGIKDIYKKGKGKFVVRARATIEDGDIVIHEVPFGVTREELMDSMVKAITGDRIESMVKTINDDSTGGENEGDDDIIRIVLELERGADPEVVLAFLYKKNVLQKNFNAQHIALVDDAPQQLGLIEYLKLFVDFRRDTITRIYTFEHGKKTQRLHIVEGFIRMIDIADEVVSTIRKADGKADSARAIAKKFGFTQAQADAIVSLQLYRISRQDLTQLQEEKKQLEDRIEFLETVLGDHDEMTEEISRQLKDVVERFKDDKRDKVHGTQIVEEVEDIELDTSDLIEKNDVVVVVKPYGVQRMSQTVYDNNHDSYRGLVVGHHNTDTTKGIALLTKHGILMQRVVDELDNTSIKNDPGDLRMTTSTFGGDDEIVLALPFDLSTYDNTGLSVISITALGQVKHSELSKSFLSFNQKGYLTRSKPYCGMKLDGDRVIACVVVPTDKVSEVNFNLKRRSGGRVTTVDMSTIKQQGNTGGGASKVKITKEGDEVMVTKNNFPTHAVAYYLEED